MGDESGGSLDDFHEARDSSLLSHSDVSKLLEEVHAYRDTMLTSLGNEKAVGVKAQLREAINGFSSALTKIATAYLCKLEVERVQGSCALALNSVCKEVKKIAVEASGSLNHSNAMTCTYSQAVSGLSYGRVSVDSNKVIINRSKPFNINRSTRITIGPRDKYRNDFLTSKATHDAVKKAISPLQLKINVARVIYARDSSVILEGDSFDTSAIKKQLVRACPKFELKPNATKNPRMIVHDVPIELSADSVLDCIVNQNLPETSSEDDRNAVKIVYMYPLRENKKQRSCVIELKPEQRKALLTKSRVYIDWKSCRISDHVSLLQCFKCLKFGHTAGECKGEACCGFCAGSHATNTCRNKANLRCKSCISSNLTTNLNHSAYDRSKCPIMRKQLDRALSFVDYGE